MDTLPDDVLLNIYIYKHNLLYQRVMNELYWHVVAIQEIRRDSKYCDDSD